LEPLVSPACSGWLSLDLCLHRPFTSSFVGFHHSCGNAQIRQAESAHSRRAAAVDGIQDQAVVWSAVMMANLKPYRTLRLGERQEGWKMAEFGMGLPNDMLDHLAKTKWWRDLLAYRDDGTPLFVAVRDNYLSMIFGWRGLRDIKNWSS
jgi:hypothetical protein